MKTSVTMVLVLVLASSAFAGAILPFTSWDDLTRKSPDIIIARCSATTPDGPVGNGMIWSAIEVLSVLKGETKPGVAQMVSQHAPRQGEWFLMFSTYQSNEIYRAYSAPETYRVVKLGHYFPLSELAGKSLDAQIQLVLRHRLDELNRELKEGADEKKRLEEGLKK